MPRGKTKKPSAQQQRHHLFLNMQWATEQFPHAFRIIGFDLAKYKTGWTVLHCETRNGKIETELVDSGLIDCSNTKSQSEAINKLYTELCNLMGKYEPDIVGYEYVAVMQDLTGFKALAKSEAMLLLASKYGLEEGDSRLLVPISIAAVKKIALGKNKENLEEARTVYKETYPNRKSNDKAAQKAIGKIAVMLATKDSFGVRFTDDNICDSFLVANGVSYLARLLHQADQDRILEQYDDKQILQWSKLKWALPFDQPRLEVGLGLCRTPTFIKENDGRANKKIVKELADLYRVVLDESDREEFGDEDAADTV